ncbi:MAG: hypothetical protein HY689_09205 [Chloroflexi bacterium]|nr:hypothetical protein [Chloroflexota bacterium]
MQPAVTPRTMQRAGIASVTLTVLFLAAACSQPAQTSQPARTGQPVQTDQTQAGGAAAQAPQTAAPPRTMMSPMASLEVVHATYVDVAGNLADLRSRVARWEQGDAGSLNIAKEKAERLRALLRHATWPPAMTGPVTKIATALEPVEQALKAQDLAAAQQQLDAIQEYTEDLEHDFYDTWVPAHKGAPLSPMTVHAGYLDLSANLSGLRSHIAAWEQGDQESLGIASEKAERIEALLHNMPWPGPLAEPIEQIETGLPAVVKGLKAKDMAATKQALAPVSEAAHDLTHDFYGKWMAQAKGMTSDAACVQMAYLDLSANVSDLRARIGQWEQGDEASLNTAKEKIERVNAVLTHTDWPEGMTAATTTIAAVVQPVEQALKAKDVAAAKQALTTMGEAPHDLTHVFYDKWLMGPMMQTP